MNKTDILLTQMYNLLVEEIETEITMDKLLQFLISQTKKKQYVITEDIQQVITLPKQLLMLCEENLKETNSIAKISGDDILNTFEDKTIFKSTNFPDIIVAKFDFSSTEEISNFLCLMTDELQLNERQQYALSMLKIALKSSNGLFTDFNKLINANLLLFNRKTYTIRTIEHELTHYLQKYTLYRIK